MHAVYKGHYGNDDLVADAARVSFAKLAEYYTSKQNAGLIQFLARGIKTQDWADLIQQALFITDPKEMEQLLWHVRRIPDHWAPFAHPHITLRMNCPVPIRTQCFKHKVGFTESEESRRYISDRPEVFVPEHFRMAAEDKKQGSGGVHPRSEAWKRRYTQLTTDAVETYLLMVEDGVCPEQSRFILPQGVEVYWVWTGSLYAFANFYNQRTDSHAQEEVQQLAREAGEIIAPLYPVSWAALTQ